MKIGFIGLGLMGRLMAANLEKAGHSIQSFDLNGSGNCRSAREAAAGASAGRAGLRRQGKGRRRHPGVDGRG